MRKRAQGGYKQIENMADTQDKQDSPDPRLEGMLRRWGAPGGGGAGGRRALRGHGQRARGACRSLLACSILCAAAGLVIGLGVMWLSESGGGKKDALVRHSLEAAATNVLEMESNIRVLQGELASVRQDESNRVAALTALVAQARQGALEANDEQQHQLAAQALAAKTALEQEQSACGR